MRRKYFTKEIIQISWPDGKPYKMHAIYSGYKILNFVFFTRDELTSYSNIKHALMACKELEAKK